MRTSLDHTRSTRRPALCLARHVARLLGALSVLMVLALSGSKADAAPTRARDIVRDLNLATDEDGACEEVEPQELLECGSEYEPTLDEPLAITLMRALDVRLTAEQCDELLADIWSQQVCVAGSRECGKMNAGAPPAPPHEWVSSSASAHSSWAVAGLSAESVRTLGFGDRTRNFGSRDLQPPVPPPRRSGH